MDLYGAEYLHGPRLIPLTDKARNAIRKLHDKGWSSEKIQKRYCSYTKRQIGSVRGWMRRGAY